MVHELPNRVVIEEISPEIDGGRFPVKRCAGETVDVRALIHADSADTLAARLLYRPTASKESEWNDAPMAIQNAGLDVWEGRFRVEDVGFYEFKIEAWIDRFATWAGALKKKSEAQLDVSSELLEGAAELRRLQPETPAEITRWIETQAKALENSKNPQGARVRAALDAKLAAHMASFADRGNVASIKTLRVRVDRARARGGAWYEFFPRSASPSPGQAATLREAEARLPEIAHMSFDVVYLPPIHPIGITHRKGPNNAIKAGPNDPGSPWAIGATSGGHMAVEPALGTLKDFDHFVQAARRLELEVALDIAFQCSPDHPYVKEHPEWFRHRPDGGIKYAENPPKKYEDIYPFDFECEAWRSLWNELRDVVLFWAKRGVRVFRVDNPHTKPYAFWEWMIADVQAAFPDAIFLAEAFTRPAVMNHLAKIGFSQSYTYFTWRTTKLELTEYLTTLTQTAVREYMRPNFFANTPDIFHEYLQHGGRPAFIIRFILAATLSGSYGIYGPPYELCEARAFPGTEDYVDSEKYQVRHWDLDRPGNIKDVITAVNRVRRDHPALQQTLGVRFHAVTDEDILCFSKKWGNDLLLIVVNLNPRETRAGNVEVAPKELGLPPVYHVSELLSGGRYEWRDSNFVRLDPAVMPAHIFHVLP
jgi:starch synthase (maltosyl-transferring)